MGWCWAFVAPPLLALFPGMGQDPHRATDAKQTTGQFGGHANRAVQRGCSTINIDRHALGLALTDGLLQTFCRG